MSCLRDVGLIHKLFAALGGGDSGSLPIAALALPLTMLAEAQAGRGQAEVLEAALQLAERLTPPLTMANVLVVLALCAATRIEKLEVKAPSSRGAPT